MLDLLFNRTPIWLFGVGTFVVLCLVAEAGFDFVGRGRYRVRGLD
jgi:hypothetical protein